MASGIVLSRAVVRDMYDNRAASMIGYVTMGMAVVTMISPAIGGALDEAYDWRASFWLLFVLGALIFVLSYKDMGETARSSGLTWPAIWRISGTFPRPPLLGLFHGRDLRIGAFFAYLGGAPFVDPKCSTCRPPCSAFRHASHRLCDRQFPHRALRGASRPGDHADIRVGHDFARSHTLLGFSLIGIATPFSFFFFMTVVGIGNGLVPPNATAGMLSVRPKLAGTASGLGGAIMLLAVLLGRVGGFVRHLKPAKRPCFGSCSLQRSRLIATIVTNRRSKLAAQSGDTPS